MREFWNAPSNLAKTSACDEHLQLLVFERFWKVFCPKWLDCTFLAETTSFLFKWCLLTEKAHAFKSIKSGVSLEFGVFFWVFRPGIKFRSLPLFFKVSFKHPKIIASPCIWHKNKSIELQKRHFSYSVTNSQRKLTRAYADKRRVYSQVLGSICTSFNWPEGARRQQVASVFCRPIWVVATRGELFVRALRTQLPNALEGNNGWRTIWAGLHVIRPCWANFRFLSLLEFLMIFIVWKNFQIWAILCWKISY